MNNYAVSSDGIATALQDSASALMEGGNNLEQATALVAAVNRVVQDPNSVGSALRTISLRLRGTSVEVLEEMGEETDNVIESTSKLQEKIKALSGVDILTASGAYKDTYTILDDILLEEPTKKGYVFTGWTVEGEGASVVDGVLTIGIGNVLVKAQWENAIP